MGNHMKNALEFALKYEGWHTYAKDKTTTGAIQRLAAKGLVEINESYRMFKAK